MNLNVTSTFTEDVLYELSTARTVYPSIASLHEGYAIIQEEVEEFWDEVKKKPRDRDKKLLYRELIQVAAMAQRTAEDLELGGD